MAFDASQWQITVKLNGLAPSTVNNGQTLVITQDNLVGLTDQNGDPVDFFAIVNADGSDIRLSEDDAGADEIPVQKVDIDTGIDRVTIWTRKPIYELSDRLVHLHIGKPDAVEYDVTDEFGRNAVWQDEIAVYHFQSDAADSSGNGYDGTVVGAILQSDGGYEFTGTDRIELPSAVDSASNLASFAFEWVNNGSTSNGHVYDTTLSAGDGYDINYRFDSMIFYVSYNTPDDDRAAQPISGPSDSGKHFGVAYRANNSVNLYLDGSNFVGDNFSDAIEINGSMAQPFIGNQANSEDPFGAGRILKSFRVRQHKSVDYYATEYANQSDPATFWDVVSVTNRASTGGGTTFSLTMPESVTLINSEFIAVNQSQHIETSESETSLSAQTLEASHTQAVALTATETRITAEPQSVYQHVGLEALVSETPLTSATFRVDQAQVVVTIESETPLGAETLSVSQVHALESVVTETLLESGAINVDQSVHLFLIESETRLTSSILELTEPGQLIVVVTETPLTAQTLEVSVSQQVSQVESESPMSAEVFQISQSVALISIDSETAHTVSPVSVGQSQHLAMLETETALQSQLFEIGTVINVNSMFSETPLTSELIEIILKNIDTDPDALKPISATLWFRLVNTTETFKLTMR